MINLKTCLVFEATWQTFRKKLITEKVYFSMKTALVIVQQNIQNTHTRWNPHIEFYKTTPSLAGPWKHT